MLAPEVPYPLAGGGALRTASLLHYLASTRHVDLIVFRQPGAPHPELHLPAGLARRVSVIDLPFHRRSTGARALRNAARIARRIPPLVDRFAGFHAEVAEALQGHTYDLGIVEHFWCAPYLADIAPHCARTVLDLHNIESALHARCAQTDSTSPALAHRVFHRASLKLESHWLPRYSEILVTSALDADRVRAISPGLNVRIYPNAIPYTELPEVATEDAIVFSGNMEYHPNRAAVRYFREQIWPTLRARFPGLVWRLVGKHPQAVADVIAGDPRIQCTGAVADAIPHIASAKVAIAPLLAGSGTRLKILEAWAAGVPVVSTSIGAEGLGARHNEHLVLADTPADFAEAVASLLASAELRARFRTTARSLLEAEFIWEKVWPLLDF